jgi:hypothetical protein
MSKSKEISFNEGETRKIADRMAKEAMVLNENAKALHTLADYKDIGKQLESTNNAIKAKIEKNEEYLKQKEIEVKTIGAKILDEELRAEGEMATINDSIKEAEKAARLRIREVYEDTSVKVAEIESRAKARIKEAEKVIRDAGERESAAITKRQKAEDEYNRFTEKLVGAR